MVYPATVGMGGAATTASIRPRNIAADLAGNIYFSDQDYNVVRKINSFGIISTVAGTGTYGFSGDGGPATAAMLNFPQQIRTDSAGNLFICDQGNQRVRKVSPVGIITTIAGDGTTGFAGDGGVATSCKLATPIGMVIRQGCGERIYISDANNNRIREIVYSNSLPRFTSGHAHYLRLCAGAGVVPLDSMLAVTDSDAGQQENWSVVLSATHGSVAATYSAVSTGGSTRPTGLSYTPTAGYTGSDTFSIIVNDCGNAPDTAIFYINVRPLPVAGTIEGVTEVCVGDTISLIGTVTGGTWAASNSHAGVIPAGTSSRVYGRNPGIDTIRYSVSDTCGTATVQQIITVKHCSNAGLQNTVIEPFFIHPNPTSESLIVEAAPGSYTSLSVTSQLGQVLLQQTITGAQTTLPVGMLAPGMYFIALQGRQGVVVRKFVKM
jgi:Secretion system C-terminal sorting domain